MTLVTGSRGLYLAGQMGKFPTPEWLLAERLGVRIELPTWIPYLTWNSRSWARKLRRKTISICQRVANPFQSVVLPRLDLAPLPGFGHASIKDTLALDRELRDPKAPLEGLASQPEPNAL